MIDAKHFMREYWVILRSSRKVTHGIPYVTLKAESYIWISTNNFPLRKLFKGIEKDFEKEFEERVEGKASEESEERIGEELAMRIEEGVEEVRRGTRRL